MNVECSIALNALSIIYMLVLIINMKYKQKREFLHYQYFGMCVMICLFLSLDIIYVSFYGRKNADAQAIAAVVKNLYFIVNSAIVWLWARYIGHIVYGEECKRKKQRFFYTGIFCVNAGIVAVNFFTGILFRISSEGTFIVGRTVMWCFTALNYLSVAAAAVVLIKYRKSLDRKDFLTFLIFPLPPLCAEIVQIFYRPFSLICTYAVSALILFQVAQNNTIYTDELTGLANRRALNETLQKWFSDPGNTVICGIMIDMDGLKFLNDTYGHLSGDKALVSLAEMIRAIKRRDIVAARYGGDEFLLIWLSKDGKDLSEIEQSLLAAKTRINDAKPEQEKIEFSLGRLCCRAGDGLTADTFLEKIDREMYRSKKEKKQKNSCNASEGAQNPYYSE